MRAASAKITKRVSGIPKPTVTAISESTAFAPLIAALKALAPTYEANMRSFHLSDAVDAVMLALQEVRASFSPPPIISDALSRSHRRICS